MVAELTGQTAPPRPTIVAFLGHQTLGDFCWEGLTAASVAAALGGARLGVIYRDDRSYKKPLVAMNPAISASFAVPENTAAVLPLDWFDPHYPDAAWPVYWREQGFDRPDLFLVPSMLINTTTIPPAPGLRIPPAMDAPLAKGLCALGVDPTRWFVCLHMRQLGYVHRRGADEKRCVDPRSYLPMIHDILFKQGGQVVRLGDPTMTPLPKLPGLIDLSRIPDSFILQAYAISRARYFVGTDSGTTQVAGAFKTPSASTNALGVGLWNDGDVILTKAIYAHDGYRLTAEELRSNGMLSLHWFRLPEMRVEDNTPEQLIDVVRHMNRITADCTGWRPPRMDVAFGDQATVAMPLRERDVVEEAQLTWWGE